MKLRDYSQEGLVSPLGYSPIGNRIKPVHIANGLCRAALGRYYEPRIFNHTLVRWAKNEERHPTDVLVAEAGDRFGEFANPKYRTQLNELRGLLKSIFGADRAVFDTQQSYTLTHHTHVTNDPSDSGTGAFLYKLLATDLGAGESPILNLLRELLVDESDELSVLSLPLVTGEESYLDLPDEDRPDSLRLRGGRGGRAFRSPIAGHLRAGFDTLAEFEAARGSKLHTLRRIVAFATFALFLHLTSRSLDYESQEFASRRPPLLLDFLQSGKTPVAAASHATYNLAQKSIERLVSYGIRDAVIEAHGERWTQKKVEEFIEETPFKGSERTLKQKRTHFREVFHSYTVGGVGIRDAFLLAFVDVYLEETSDTPLDFARTLGVRGGLLAPRGSRAVQKRYAPSAELLEVLLAAATPLGRDLEVEELAELWWERYGILTGARAADAGVLTGWSIFDATKGDLAENAEALRESLIEIGYARRYADGVTIIRSDVGGGHR